MTNIGDKSTDFTLQDQFGRDVQLSKFAGVANVMLLFYPLDWTPT